MDKRFKHGHARYRNMTSTYEIWVGMHQRCSNPNHHVFFRYGGRGIKVCERWADYASFLADMGERPEGLSLERINNDGNYEPGNCSWSTMAQQARNTSRTVMITYNGETMCMKDWAHRIGLRQDTLWYRLKRGMSIEDALTFPLMESYSHRRKLVTK